MSKVHRLGVALVTGLLLVTACSAEGKIDTKDGVKIEGDVDKRIKGAPLN